MIYYKFLIPEFNFESFTDGSGYWSSTSKKIICKKAALILCEHQIENNYFDFGELRVYYNKSQWNNNKYGLIYTDKLWLFNLKKYLSTKFSKKELSRIQYSEQGMQGDNYVSLDVYKYFILKIIKNNKGKILKWI